MMDQTEFRKPFQESWDGLPTSVQNHVRIAIIMVAVWFFLAGVVFGVFVL